MTRFNPVNRFAGGYTQRDATIEFYLRINALIKPEFEVVDIGAGRAAWMEKDPDCIKTSLRTLKGKVKRVTAIDVDEAVYQNASADLSLLIENCVFPLPDQAVDLAIADFVLEHVEDPWKFCSEVDRILKPGGFFCARTPHITNYITIISNLLPERIHSRALKVTQPLREEQDIFPTFHRLNTMTKIKGHFPNYSDLSYFYKTDPAYYAGSRIIYRSAELLHSILPAAMVGSMLVFLRKSPTA